MPKRFLVCYVQTCHEYQLANNYKYIVLLENLLYRLSEPVLSSICS